MNFAVFVVLCVVVIHTAESMEVKSKCEVVDVNRKNHTKNILTNGQNRPYQLSFFKHIIYFSYNVESDKKDSFEIGYLNLSKTIPTPITAVKNGFATAINHHHGIAYLGGSDGIYAHQFKEPSGESIEHVVKEHNIWDLFYKERLYFIVYPSQRLHRKHENSFELVEHIYEKIYQFAIDGDDDTFITTVDGVLHIKNGTKERIPFTGPKIFRAIEVDNQGVAHFCGQNDIYIANKEKNALEKIAHIKNIFGLTFDDKNHIIYSDPHEIVKLLPGTCK